MDDELLVRIYNVGLGDCIYVRVPDQQQHRHILIDCGNTDGDKTLLGRAIDHLAQELENDSTDNHALDLLVVTHPHSDHIAGFGAHADKFLALDIRQMWLTASMDPDHPDGQQARQLQAFSDNVLQEFSRLALGPGMDDLTRELFSLSNAPSLDALRKKLPKKNNYQGDKPLYVHDDAEPPSVFTDPGIKLHVLGPRRNIDKEYLGNVGDALALFKGHEAAFVPEGGRSFAENWESADHRPANISAGDFRRLRGRLFKNALAFVLSNNELVNNTSVVLLLEWGGRRLLFTGDAQFKKSRNGKYEEGKANGSWNVMWHYHHDELRQAVDFLKVGHHGSHNATPWVPPEAGKPKHPVNDILDALVPSSPRTTEIVVSTERMKYPSIPDRKLITELGKRAKTRHKYDEPEHLKGRMTGSKWSQYDPEEELVPTTVLQPARTDLDYQRTGQEVRFIDRSFPRVAGS